MARSTRRKRAQKADRSIGLILGVLGVILIAILAGGAWYLRRAKVQIDAETNCPKGGPTSVHLLIFDRSDPITRQQAQHIQQEVMRLEGEAQFGNRFDIYTFDGDSKSVLLPKLVVCSPGRPENANELIENPEFVRKRFEQQFSAVLTKTVEDLLRENTMEKFPNH